MEPTTDTTEQDLTELFGLDTLSEEEQADFIASIGTTLFQSALLTFTLSLSDAERDAFEVFVAGAGEGEELMENIALHYPAFSEELNVEITRFRENALMLMDPEHGSRKETV
ncbi:hypothetical protein K2Q16_03095 [Patescibacteria group bacterium]|nr:hypothetical protein [Patescibacteria group bacterium]